MTLSTTPEISSEQNMLVLNDNITPMTPETSASFHSLSLGQQALWFLYQIAPKSVAYNIFDRALIRSTIDIPAWHRAWQKIVDRHPMLRITYTTCKGKPFQISYENMEICTQVTEHIILNCWFRRRSYFAPTIRYKYP